MTHDFGRFVWFELMSAQADRAAAFYGEVVGWKVKPMAMPDFEYPMLHAGETPVGGLVGLPKPEVPPHWVSYLSVEDVDASAQRVIELGGKPLMDAVDAPPVGRMQVVTDAQGAAFFLFRSASGDAPAATGPGSFHWNELVTADPEAAVAFYEKAFGFTHETMDMPNGTYFVLKNGDRMRGGVVAAPEGAPNHWTQYVTVDDCDAALDRAARAGGQVAVPAVDVPGVGRFGHIEDPVGGRIGLITPAAK